jgi:hypothetical protein
MIVSALNSLRPGAAWTLNGDTLDGLTWLDAGQTRPTDSEILAEAARLQAEHEARAYQRQRAAEYPSFADQLDTLYHGGYDAWKAAIQAVKDKYPKGQA